MEMKEVRPLDYMTPEKEVANERMRNELKGTSKN